MAECCQGASNDQDVADPPQVRPVEGDPPDFDFIERPSEDFFCPVTLELLLDPHQTRCCGNHLSEKVVLRLQRDGKPCPMCKNPQLDTVPDKFHGRKVKAVRVRCLYKANGCEWVGEVGGLKQHVDSCPKRPWECQYCKFASTYDVRVNHEEHCMQYPTPCPNKCEVGTVPRCNVESHRKKCSLELVSCEFVDVGCNVKIARRDLRKHMEESQQQHILSATFLNLRLSKETIAEKDRQLAEKDNQLAEKDHKLIEILAEKDNQLAKKDRLLADKDRQVTESLAEKDHQLAEKDHQLTKILAEKDRQLAEKDHQLAEKDRQLTKVYAEKDRQLAEKDHQLAEKDRQLTTVFAEKDRQLAEKDHQLTEKDRQLTEKDHQLTTKLIEKDHQLANKDKIIKRRDEIITSKEIQVVELQKQIKLSVDHVKVGVNHLLGGMKHCQLFTVDKVSPRSKWLSDPFYSHRNGYKLRLFVINHLSLYSKVRAFYTSGMPSSEFGDVLVGLVLCKGEFDHQLNWPVTFYVDLQLQNQVKPQKHIQRSYEYVFLKCCEEQEMGSEQKDFATSAMLCPEGPRASSPYIVNGNMELRLWIHS